MAEILAWFRDRLSNRPDSEHGQALVRIVLILLILGYVLLPSSRRGLDPDTYWDVLAIVLSGLVLSCGIFAWLLAGPAAPTCAGWGACSPTTGSWPPA